MAPAINATVSTPFDSTTVANGTLNTTESTTSDWEYVNTTSVTIWINGGGYDGPYMLFYPSYVIYIVLVFLFVIAFPLAMIMVSPFGMGHYLLLLMIHSLPEERQTQARDQCAESGPAETTR